MYDLIHYIRKDGEWVLWVAIAASPYLIGVWSGQLKTTTDFCLISAASMVITITAVIARHRCCK